MIREMEETLVELKASCAATMADRKRVERELAEVEERALTWDGRARLAVEKGRDDLAREALLERNRWTERAEGLKQEQGRFDQLVEQAQSDIQRLEEKLESAVEKKRLLVQRHICASQTIRAENDLKRADHAEAILRFEQFEQRIDRIEAEAMLLKRPRQSAEASLDEQFSLLEKDTDIELQLSRLKDELKAARSLARGAESKE